MASDANESSKPKVNNTSLVWLHATTTKPSLLQTLKSRVKRSRGILAVVAGNSTFHVCRTIGTSWMCHPKRRLVGAVGGRKTALAKT
jgi:hypothetical protein